MSDFQFSAIEQLAQAVESWGDGWRFLYNPDDHGRRARLARDHSETITVEIEIIEEHAEPAVHLLYIGCNVRMADGRRQPVSVSARNPVNRAALEWLNAQLDSMAKLSELDRA